MLRMCQILRCRRFHTVVASPFSLPLQTKGTLRNELATHLFAARPSSCNVRFSNRPSHSHSSSFSVRGPQQQQQQRQFRAFATSKAATAAAAGEGDEKTEGSAASQHAVIDGSGGVAGEANAPSADCEHAEGRADDGEALPDIEVPLAAFALNDRLSLRRSSSSLIGSSFPSPSSSLSSSSSPLLPPLAVTADSLWQFPMQEQRQRRTKPNFAPENLSNSSSGRKSNNDIIEEHYSYSPIDEAITHYFHNVCHHHHGVACPSNDVSSSSLSSRRTPPPPPLPSPLVYEIPFAAERYRDRLLSHAVDEGVCNEALRRPSPRPSRQAHKQVRGGGGGGGCVVGSSGGENRFYFVDALPSKQQGIDALLAEAIDDTEEADHLGGGATSSVVTKSRRVAALSRLYQANPLRFLLHFIDKALKDLASSLERGEEGDATETDNGGARHGRVPLVGWSIDAPPPSASPPSSEHGAEDSCHNARGSHNKKEEEDNNVEEEPPLRIVLSYLHAAHTAPPEWGHHSSCALTSPPAFTTSTDDDDAEATRAGCEGADEGVQEETLTRPSLPLPTSTPSCGHTLARLMQCLADTSFPPLVLSPSDAVDPFSFSAASSSSPCRAADAVDDADDDAAVRLRLRLEPRVMPTSTLSEVVVRVDLVEEIIKEKGHEECELDGGDSHSDSAAKGDGRHHDQHSVVSTVDIVVYNKALM